MRVVLDTNVVVSALRNEDGNPALVVDLILTGTITLVYSAAILAEYREVLARPRLQLDPALANDLCDELAALGIPRRASCCRPFSSSTPSSAPSALSACWGASNTRSTASVADASVALGRVKQEARPLDGERLRAPRRIRGRVRLASGGTGVTCHIASDI